MKVHEYQARELLSAYGIPVPGGMLVQTAEEAAAAAEQLGGSCVLKAQVHSGGRGKAGGVKLAHTPEEARTLAESMLGMKLVTKQTGPEGKIVRKLLAAEPVKTAKEYYLSLTVDHESAGLVLIGSGAGGTEIEEISAQHPEWITQQKISVMTGLKGYHGRSLAQKMGIPAALQKDFQGILEKMVRLFWDKDCSLIEINPLVETTDGRLLALDAKVNFDDNGLMKHSDVAAMRDLTEEDPKEADASKFGLNYIALHGNIGCMVNGAGLAMATMDIIQKFGGAPANFLDVGGSASAEKVAAAFEIILSDPQVQVILVNIFGGIMKCDVIAQGIVAAAQKIQIRVPVVVRLEGTNVELGKQILKESGLNLISASDMADAARKSVACVQGRKEEQA